MTIQLIGGTDIGSSYGKYVLGYYEKKKRGNPIMGKTRTMVSEITEAQFTSGEVRNAIKLDFVGGENVNRYFAVGNSATARNNKDIGWSFKYTPSVYTPAFYYALASGFMQLGIKSGQDINMRIANTHNINTTAAIVRKQSFPFGVGSNNIYKITALNVSDSGVKEYTEYNITIEADEKSGCIFPKETSAAMVYRQLELAEKKMDDEAKKPHVIMDIGWSTSQVYAVMDGKVVSDFSLDMGIGEIQQRVLSGLSSIYDPHEIANYNIELYMRDAGQLPKDRIFGHTSFLKDVIELVTLNGRETAETLINSIDAGFLRLVVLAGGGGVQLNNLIIAALENRKKNGEITSFSYPVLLIGPSNNEFGNALGAYRGILARNGG